MAPVDEGVTRVEALQKFGITVSEVDGWEDRGGATFSPIGILIHHTASDNTRLSTILNGNGYTPGPLVQGYIEDNPENRCWVVADNRCNHAGVGDPGVLDRMRADLPVQFPPGPDQAGAGGNTYLEGVELEGDGVGDDFAASGYVYSTGVRYAAAMCWWRDWNPLTRVAGHKEWSSPRKTDPNLDMNVFRVDVARTMTEVLDMPFLPCTRDHALTHGDGTRKSEVAYCAGRFRSAYGYSVATVPADGSWPTSMVNAIKAEVGGDGFRFTGNQLSLIEDVATSGRLDTAEWEARIAVIEAEIAELQEFDDRIRALD